LLQTALVASAGPSAHLQFRLRTPLSHITAMHSDHGWLKKADSNIIIFPQFVNLEQGKKKHSENQTPETLGEFGVTLSAWCFQQMNLLLGIKPWRLRIRYRTCLFYVQSTKCSLLDAKTSLSNRHKSVQGTHHTSLMQLGPHLMRGVHKGCFYFLYSNAT